MNRATYLKNALKSVLDVIPKQQKNLYQIGEKVNRMNDLRLHDKFKFPVFLSNLTLTRNFQQSLKNIYYIQIYLTYIFYRTNSQASICNFFQLCVDTGDVPLISSVIVTISVCYAFLLNIFIKQQYLPSAHCSMTNFQQIS